MLVDASDKIGKDKKVKKINKKALDFESKLSIITKRAKQKISLAKWLSVKELG